MKIRFYIDPTTGLPHIYNHQVDETEVKDVLTNLNEDRPGTGNSRVAIGRTEAGRILRVIYVRDPKPVAFRRRMKKKRR